MTTLTGVVNALTRRSSGWSRLQQPVGALLSHAAAHASASIGIRRTISRILILQIGHGACPAPRRCVALGFRRAPGGAPATTVGRTTSGEGTQPDPPPPYHPPRRTFRQ